MDAFDGSKYINEAKEKWGGTAAYAEFSEKTKGHSGERFAEMAAGLDMIMWDFAMCMQKDTEPGSPEAQNLVEKLQNYITKNYYTCTDEILAGLGQMYSADERFKANIDRHAEGTAGFISAAVRIYCGR